MELVAIVDPATSTWSKYNLDMKPTKELAEMYEVQHAGFWMDGERARERERERERACCKVWQGR